jgi:opacity protein-like surface antigen
MRSVKFLVAAGAASLLSSTAFAADMAIAPPPQYYAPPVEDFGGWYLRGDIGFSNQSVKSVRNTNDALYAPVTSLTQTTGFDTGGTFQVGVGYQFNSWFRADITGQYRGNTNFHGTDILRATAVASNVYPYSGVDNYNASKSEFLFLANAYADLGTWWSVTPFVGAGIGASRVTISNFTDQSQVNTIFNQATNTYGPGAQPGLASAPAASKWNFAWALHTGLAYKVTPNVTLELAYSYVNLGDGVTGSVTTFDGFTTNHVMTFKNITSNDLKLGVRWNLDSPPVYAPPPLVTKG